VRGRRARCRAVSDATEALRSCPWVFPADSPSEARVSLRRDRSGRCVASAVSTSSCSASVMSGASGKLSVRSEASIATGTSAPVRPMSSRKKRCAGIARKCTPTRCSRREGRPARGRARRARRLWRAESGTGAPRRWPPPALDGLDVLDVGERAPVALVDRAPAREHVGRRSSCASPSAAARSPRLYLKPRRTASQ
jgi:hypothetical protein